MISGQSNCEWQAVQPQVNGLSELPHPQQLTPQGMVPPGIPIMYPQPHHVLTSPPSSAPAWDPNSSQDTSGSGPSAQSTLTTFVNTQSITSPASTSYMNSVKTEPPTSFMPQLAQHHGMFPQAYLIPNGHASTADYVQAQAQAQAAVAAAQGQAVAVDGSVPSTSVGYSVTGQPIIMMDPNQVPNGGVPVTHVQTLALPAPNTSTAGSGSV
uniref:Uncharacterized protein n=1 Tax=Ciona savignyi TaxID=51511 RepID=H2YWU6_CIOSA